MYVANLRQSTIQWTVSRRMVGGSILHTPGPTLPLVMSQNRGAFVSILIEDIYYWLWVSCNAYMFTEPGLLRQQKACTETSQPKTLTSNYSRLCFSDTGLRISVYQVLTHTAYIQTSTLSVWEPYPDLFSIVSALFCSHCT